MAQSKKDQAGMRYALIKNDSIKPGTGSALPKGIDRASSQAAAIAARRSEMNVAATVTRRGS